MTPDIAELKRLAQKATKRIADRVNPIFDPSSLPPETVNLSYCANCRSASDPEFIHTCAYGCKAKLHSGCVLNHNWDFHREEVYESDTNIVAANPQTILALIERLETLEECLKTMFGYMESGFLVRDTTHDSEPGWAIRMVQFTVDLEKCYRAISAPDAAELEKEAAAIKESQDE